MCCGVCSFADNDGQLLRAARILQRSLMYRQKILDRAIPQERAGKDLLSMDQYGRSTIVTTYSRCDSHSLLDRLFGASRIARPTCDTFSVLEPDQSRHVCVMSRGNFFTFNPFDSNGQVSIVLSRSHYTHT